MIQQAVAMKPLYSTPKTPRQSVESAFSRMRQRGGRMIFSAPIVLAAVLTFSAISKAANLRKVERAIRLFMDRAGLARGIAATSALSEWGVAISLLLWPSSPIVRGGLIFLFAAFGAFGVSALVSGRKVDCGCFGSLYAGHLGWTQVGQLAVVAPIAVLLFPRSNWPLTSASVAIVAVYITVTATFILTAIPAWREIRQQRQSLDIGRNATQLADWKGLARG